MKNKLCVCLLLIILSCLFISCSNNAAQNNTAANIMQTAPLSQGTFSVSTPRSNCMLIVNGKDITNGNYVRIDKEQTALPFTAIMEALGSRVTWLNQTTAIIIFRNKSYILNTSDCTLVETGGKTNFLSAPPGGIRHYKMEGNEFILDYCTMAGAFQLMKAEVEIKIDYDDNIITINGD